MAARYCDRLLLLDHGAVLADGSPADVLSDSALALAYGITIATFDSVVGPAIVPLSRVQGTAD